MFNDATEFLTKNTKSYNAESFKMSFPDRIKEHV